MVSLTQCQTFPNRSTSIVEQLSSIVPELLEFNCCLTASLGGLLVAELAKSFDLTGNLPKAYAASATSVPTRFATSGF